MPHSRESDISLDRARFIACLVHQGQVDKAGNLYYYHVLAVSDLLAEYGEDAQIAGVLHDTVEDTILTLDHLRAIGCSEAVVSAVDAVTKRDDETYLDAVRRAARDPLGRLVKLADNQHNSDEGRLALLPEKTRSRLRKKYAQAREILGGN